MSLQVEELKRLLTEADLIKEKAFEEAQLEAEAKKMPLVAYLTDSALVSDEHLGQVLAGFYGVRFVRLSGQKLQEETVRLLPEAFSRAHTVVVISKTDVSATVATADPGDLSMKSLLEKHLRCKVLFVYATPKDIENHLFLHRKDPKTAIAAILQTPSQAGTAVDTTVIKLVDTILGYAYQGGASDVHVEPEGEYSMVRYRVDGLLHDIARVPGALHEKMITRLKVLARLATDQHRVAQDGKLFYKSGFGDEVEIRLSVLPTTHAEKAVMRLLSDKNRSFSLADLGLSESDFKALSSAIQRPWGMILVTGPTGSGKSTTLYSVLKILNKREVNITTIEDPVEYDLEGVTQTQVNEKAGMTFAKGLRSLVRQDPDIIMVGEIRDKETADISVNAAMTGHLVLSTLHTNDAATAFPRLQDMGVEDFLIASTVQLIIAQRLVRKVCASCIASVDLNPTQRKIIQSVPGMEQSLLDIAKKKDLLHMRVFTGAGCPACHQTGYAGRIGIFELLSADDAVRAAVMEKRNADEIRDLATKAGMKTMLYDGLRKVVVGQTTMEEVLRVTKE